jgi:hypothetical protein
VNAHINGRNVVVVATGVDSPETRAAARKAACGEAHTATIGKLVKVAEGAGKVTYTWGPVTPRGTRKAAPAASVSDLVALEIAELQARLAELTGAAPAPAAPRAEFAPIKAARERREAAACETCLDYGVVRGAGKHAGEHYRTADGAAASTAKGNSRPCEARGCKAGKAARKAASKAA